MEATTEASDLELTMETTKQHKSKNKSGDPKFAEVNYLMNKYDKAEAHVKWINSPEYAQQQEAKERDNEQKAAQNHKPKSVVVEVDPAVLAKQQREVQERKKESLEAEHSMYITDMVDQYCMHKESDE